MNSPINLGSETLTDNDVATLCALASKDRFISIFDTKNPEDVKPISMPDFGTVFIGFAVIKEVENLDLFLRDQEVPWIAPESWKLGHVAKRFGMFPSIGQASKNGFGAEIPQGFSQVVLRVNKVRGVLTFVKK